MLGSETISHVLRSVGGIINPSPREGSNWINEDTAEEVLEKKIRFGTISEKMAPHLMQFIRDGYTIFQNVVSEELTEKIKSDLDLIWESRRADVIALTDFKHVPVPETDRKKARLLDLYMKSEAARAALFNPVICEFMTAVYRTPGQLFQSLSFDVGSAQRLHQDPFYVRVPSNPGSVMASWIALEDVSRDAGPLMYYPGSHRIEPFEFAPSRFHFIPDIDGNAKHQECLNYLDAVCESRFIKKHFLPRRGDMLLWSAYLAHGGEKINNRDLTRKSLVGHYCPAKSVPNFGVLQPETYRTFRAQGQHVMSSAYYRAVSR